MLIKNVAPKDSSFCDKSSFLKFMNFHKIHKFHSKFINFHKFINPDVDMDF